MKLWLAAGGKDFLVQASTRPAFGEILAEEIPVRTIAVSSLRMGRARAFNVSLLTTVSMTFRLFLKKRT